MIERLVVLFAKRYRCGRRFAAFLLLGLAVDAAMAVAVIVLFVRLFWGDR